MDLRNLNTFILAAELHSFTRAGEALGYSQPTVSFQIRQLEQEMGVQLFERIGHTVKLTDAGRSALEYAQKICRMTDEMAQHKSAAGAPSGVIRIAMAESLCMPMVIHEFARFRSLYPGVALQVTTAGTGELFRLLDHNEADLVCTLDSHIYNTNYITASEEKTGVHFVAPPGHPLADMQNISMEELMRHPLLMTERNMSYGRLLCEYLAQHNMEARPVLETSSPQQLCRLVSQGAGISFLPDFITADGVQAGDLVRLDVHGLHVDVWKQLLYHRGKWMSRQLQAVIDHLSRIRLFRD